MAGEKESHARFPCRDSLSTTHKIGRPELCLTSRDKRNGRLNLRKSEDDEFTTMDVLAGLRGVCQAFDEAAGKLR